MTALKIILTALGIVKGLLQWFRDKSIADVAAKAERARVIEAEREFQDVDENIKPVTPDNVVDRLRRHEF